ncbi:MAG: hypothetical protein P1V19_10420, partial [Gimesia sp.]|nr:hypothetical protein [Gimesia sp.]
NFAGGSRIMNINHVILIFISLSLTGSPFPLLAEKPTKKAVVSPVEARLIVKQSKYVLPKGRYGNAFRKQIEEETDSDKLPAAPKVNLVLELKNISQKDVMIFPRGSIIYPDLTVKGKGVVQPENLRSISGESSGSSIQPTIAPGKSYRLSISSLNPNGGTAWYYWCEPGEYTITATYTVYTGLPPFPFPEKTKPKGKPQKYTVTTPPIKVKVVLYDNRG